MQHHAGPMTLSERADELEERMMNELNERIATKSVLFNMGDGKVEMESGAALQAKHPGKYFLMGADPRLPKMPDKPTLIDFFKARFASTNHLLQSATHALRAGLDEKTILACLLHSAWLDTLLVLTGGSGVVAAVNYWRREITPRPPHS